MTVKVAETANLKEHLKKLSAQDFKNFGLHQIAYVRPKIEKGKTIYGVYAADGNEVTTAKTVELAIVIAKQNELDPVTTQ